MGKIQWRTNVFELDLTYRCTLSCPNCTRRCDILPGEGTDIPLEAVKEMLRQTRKTGHVWNHILLMGGDPTLYPKLQEVLQLLNEYKRTTQATRVSIVSNDKTAYTKGVLSMLPDWVEQRRSPKDGSTRFSTKNDEFWTMNVAPVDFPEFANFDYRRGCQQQVRCGLAYTTSGWYFCSMMVGIDRVFRLRAGVKGLSDILRPIVYTKQLDVLCRFCGRIRVGFGLKQHEFQTKEEVEMFKQNIKTYPLYSGRLVLSQSYKKAIAEKGIKLYNSTEDEKEATEESR